MSDQNVKNSGSVLAICCAMVLAGDLLRAWLISKTWGWFVLPLFPALPALTFLTAWGLDFFVFVLLLRLKTTKSYRDHTDHQLLTLGIIAVAVPLLLLGGGYVLHLIIEGAA